MYSSKGYHLAVQSLTIIESTFRTDSLLQCVRLHTFMREIFVQDFH